ncbi:hypothetical protein SASPL_138508 [Salvia splendens]|uniref:Syntaxin N-terminal domain-containing protein n=1 Tax=Salvia splendens TaxID=180675 RepID=A0A8X8WVK7_SALSN|nr:hypothetical protein SASPL_138508 [Salvia splendens]
MNSRDQGNRNGDIEMGMGMGMDRQTGDQGLEDFFKQVQVIEKQYEKLNALLRKLQDSHEESKAITKAAAMKAIKKRMEKDVDEVGKIARTIKLRIEELDKELMFEYMALKKRFKDKMTEFQTLRLNIHKEYHEVVERRVFTVFDALTGTRADEEVKSVVP